MKFPQLSASSILHTARCPQRQLSDVDHTLRGNHAMFGHWDVVKRGKLFCELFRLCEGVRVCSAQRVSEYDLTPGSKTSSKS